MISERNLFLKDLLIYLYACYIPIHIYVFHVCMQVPTEAKRQWVPGTEVTGGWEPPDVGTGD